jgi:hypothetical protein
MHEEGRATLSTFLLVSDRRPPDARAKSATLALAPPDTRVESSQAHAKQKCCRYFGKGAVHSMPPDIREGAWTRDQEIAMYQAWLKTQNDRLELIRLLPSDAVLACVCTPHACHGDMLMELWQELHEVSG